MINTYSTIGITIVSIVNYYLFEHYLDLGSISSIVASNISFHLLISLVLTIEKFNIINKNKPNESLYKKILSAFNKSFQVTSLTVVLMLAVPFIPVIGEFLSLPEMIPIMGEGMMFLMMYYIFTLFKKVLGYTDKEITTKYSGFLTIVSLVTMLGTSWAKIGLGFLNEEIEMGPPEPSYRSEGLAMDKLLNSGKFASNDRIRELRIINEAEKYGLNIEFPRKKYRMFWSRPKFRWEGEDEWRELTKESYNDWEGFFPEDFEFWKIKGSANMRL